MTSPKTFAGEGSPAIDEFCVPEFATMLGRTNDSAGRFLTDCVEVAYRLPRLWAAVQNGLVAGWRARLIAQTTLALTLEAATYVDEQVFWCASRLTPSALGRLVDEARVRYMPEQVKQALERSADKRHVTFDTQQVSFDGTMALEASLELPDALALAEAVKSGAEHLAKLGSTDTIDGRRATARGDLAPATGPGRRRGQPRRAAGLDRRTRGAERRGLSRRAQGSPGPWVQRGGRRLGRRPRWSRCR